ncbi:MAG: hypothetical protein KF819_08620 [Labilithrix sp.]|nr:hypothetical protein [Labilithrix sp.]
MEDAFLRTERLLLTEIPAVLAQTGIPVTRTIRRPPAVTGRTVLGTIGFGGPHLRGALSLLAQVAMWERSMPVAVGPPPFSDQLLADFVGEVCNLLVGRFRNRLLRHGVMVLPSTPTAVCGAHIEMPRFAAATSAWYELEAQTGAVHARFDVTFDESFVFDGEDAVAVEPNDADLILF